MTEASARVIPAQLLQNMREDKVHKWIVELVGNFISNRTMTLGLPGYSTDSFCTHVGISLGSPLSPILFHSYNANLVNTLNFLTPPCLGPA
jgi:hypothetical protein